MLYSKYWHFVPPRNYKSPKPRHPFDDYQGDHDIDRLKKKYPVGCSVQCVKEFADEYRGPTPNFTLNGHYKVVGYRYGYPPHRYPGDCWPRPRSECLDASVVLQTNSFHEHGMSDAWMNYYFKRLVKDISTSP